MGIQGWQWLLILAVILLLFGAAKLPALAKSMGQSARVFKGEMKAMKDEDKAAEPGIADSTVAPSSSTTVTSHEPSSNTGRTTDSTP